MTRNNAVLESWTEHERGWGSRPDGCSIHLSEEDRRLFVEAYNAKYNNEDSAPDEYASADHDPKDVMIEQSLTNELTALRDRGFYGRFLSRDEERHIKNPPVCAAVSKEESTDSVKFDVVLKNIAGQPFDPCGRNLAGTAAGKRVQDLAMLGIESFLVRSL